MQLARIAELLGPFLAGAPPTSLVQAISSYLDLLLRWNSRMNLTAVRDPEQIVTRHFGESLFAAGRLYPAAVENASLIDVGSGAGFPGIPIKLYAPSVDLTLIESKARKATFLREVLRNLNIAKAAVFVGRAEDYATSPRPQLTVTLRAVEKFEDILPTVARMARSSVHGRLALLIGESQVKSLRSLTDFDWQDPAQIPQSNARVLAVGHARVAATDSGLDRRATS